MHIQWLKPIAIILSILLVSCSSARIAQQLQQGRLNFEAGYYRKAFQQLLPLAAEGNREAQYAVGYLYYYGYGTSQDSDSGMFWIQRAAGQRYAPALRALQEINQQDSRE